MYTIVKCGGSAQEECSSVSTCSESLKVHRQSILKHIFRRENIWHNVVLLPTWKDFQPAANAKIEIVFQSCTRNSLFVSHGKKCFCYCHFSSKNRTISNPMKLLTFCIMYAVYSYLQQSAGAPVACFLTHIKCQ